MRWMLLLLLAVAGSACRAPTADNQLVTDRGADKDQWWSALPRAGWAEFSEVAQLEPWFEVFEVADGVLAIYEPGQFEEVISYLIVGQDRALLFDTGLGIGDMGALVARLTELPVTVLNSHTHYDHIGGNHQFEAVLATATRYTRKRANGLSHTAVKEFVGPGWIWKPTPTGFDRANYLIEPFAITRTVADGERIDLGGRELEVLLTPGHAPDALCLLDRRARLLFTGDTFYPAPLYAHLPGSDVAEYATSAKRLARLVDDVDHLLPGHNEPMVDAAYLPALASALQAVLDGSAGYQLTDGNREYGFDGFSIIAPDR